MVYFYNSIRRKPFLHSDCAEKAFVLCFEVPQNFMFLKVVHTVLSISQSDKNIKTIRARRVCGCCAVTVRKRILESGLYLFIRQGFQQLDINMFSLIYKENLGQNFFTA